MPLNLFDALLESAPSQSDGATYSDYFNTSATPTPTQSSYLTLYPPSQSSSSSSSSSSPVNQQPPYPPYPSSQSHYPTPEERLNELELARSTYWELLDWMNEFANQAPPKDREGKYLQAAEFKRVRDALLQQAELVKSLTRAYKRQARLTSSPASSSSPSSSSSSSPSASA